MADPGADDLLARQNQRIAQLEEENHTLASLYVAAYQLHASLELREVLRTIVEILINFVGAKSFALYVVDEGSGRLRAVAAHDVAGDTLARSTLAEQALAGQASADAPGAPPLVVPLRRNQRTVGAIAIWALLAHKPGFDETDRALFELLAAHAAGALEAARLAAGGGSLAEIV